MMALLLDRNLSIRVVCCCEDQVLAFDVKGSDHQVFERLPDSDAPVPVKSLEVSYLNAVLWLSS